MNVAIIGCRSMGCLHAQMATRCGLRIAACADKHEEAAKALAKQYEAQATTDCRGVIRRPDVDIVLVATPTPTHADFVVAAAKAGKHVFCEKPFGRTLQQCRTAAAAAKKAKIKLFVGHVVRYFHEFEAIKAQIDGGVIGTPGYAKLYRGGMFPGGPDGWFADYGASGGVTLDCMIHDLDWLRHAFGEPERIFCQALRRKTPELIDYSQVTLRMKNGLIATLVGTWAHPAGFRVKVEVCGDRGMVQYDSAQTPLVVKPRQTKGKTGETIVPASPVEKSPYQREWEEFIAWIEGGREPRVTVRDASRAVEMALAALKSADSGKPVRL